MESDLRGAAGAGDAAAVQRLVAAGEDPSGSVGADGLSPLHLAAAGGHVPAVLALLAARARIDAAAADGATPLLAAAAAGQHAAMEVLVRSGANVNLARADGTAPLHFVCASSNVALTSLLLRFGASLEARNARGQTPIDIVSAGALEHQCAAAGSRHPSHPLALSRRCKPHLAPDSLSRLPASCCWALGPGCAAGWPSSVLARWIGGACDAKPEGKRGAGGGGG
jgi:ankyrin repeat protein